MTMNNEDISTSLTHQLSTILERFDGFAALVNGGSVGTPSTPWRMHIALEPRPTREHS